MKVLLKDGLASRTNCIAEHNVKGKYVGDVLESLFADYPQLLVHLLAENGKEASKTSVKLNGKYLVDNKDIFIQVTEEDVLVIAQDVPSGESASARLIAGIGILALTWWTGIGAAGGWAMAGETMAEGLSFAGTMAVGMGVSLALGGVAELIAGTPSVPSADGNTSAPTYGFSGVRNTTASGTPIPIVYGKHRLGGHLLNVYTSLQGQNTYLSAQLGLCEGEIEGIDINTIKINERELKYYPDVDVYWRSGTSSQVDGYGAPPAALQSTSSNRDKIVLGDSMWKFKVGTSNHYISAYYPINQMVLSVAFDYKFDDRHQVMAKIYSVGDDGSTKEVAKGILNTVTRSAKDFKIKRDVTFNFSKAYSGTFLVTLEIQDPNVHGNSAGVTGYTLTNTNSNNPDIAPQIYGFNLVENTASYNLKVGTSGTVVSTIGSVDSVRTTITAPSMYKVSKSDIQKTSVELKILYRVTGQEDTFTVTGTAANKSKELTVNSVAGIKIGSELDITGIDTPRYVRGISGNVLTLDDTVSAVTNASITVTSWIEVVPPQRDEPVQYPDWMDVGVLSNKNNWYIEGKTRSEVKFQLDFRLPTLEQYDIKFLRITPEHTGDLKNIDDVFVSDFTEIVHDSFIYPHTALLGFRMKATEQLNGGMPTISSIVSGLKVAVPCGYDPVTRVQEFPWNGKLTTDYELDTLGSITANSDQLTVTDTSDVFLGMYVRVTGAGPVGENDAKQDLIAKVTAINGLVLTLDTTAGALAGHTPVTNLKKLWTDNPVWCLYDLLVNERYGLGAYFKVNSSKRSSFMLANFKIEADYCDEYIREDGSVTTYEEGDGVPRFSLNIVLDSSRSSAEWAATIAGIFRGTLYYTNGLAYLNVDRPKNISHIYNVSSLTNYKQSNSSLKEIPNVIEVQFPNKDKEYELDVFLVETANKIEYPSLEERRKTLNLIGIPDEDQCKRLAKYSILSAQHNITTVSFTVFSEGLQNTIGDIIGVQHDVPQWGIGGRIKEVNGNVLTLDSEVSLGDGPYFIKIQNTSGAEGYTYSSAVVDGTILEAGGEYTEVTLFEAPSVDIIPNALFAIGLAGVTVKPFRIVNLKRSSDETVEITAIEYVDIYAEADNLSTNTGLYITSKPTYSMAQLPFKKESVTNFDVQQLVAYSSNASVKTGVEISYTLPNSSSDWAGAVIHYRDINSSSYLQLPLDTTGRVVIDNLEYNGKYMFVAASAYKDGSKQTINEALDDNINVPFKLIELLPQSVSRQNTSVVNGITLDGNPNGTTFDGKDLKVNWKLGSTLDINVDLPADEEEYGVDTALSQSWFSHYVVKVLDSDNTVRRTAPELKTNTFTYTHAENYADGSGVPLRSFEVQVEAVDKLAQVSTPIRIQVSNPVPAALTGFTVTPVFQGFHVTFDPSKEPDIQGYVIHASRTSGFTPSDANLINNGSETSKTYRVSTKGVWYVKAAAYDYYDRADAVDYSQLNYTAEQVVVVAEQQIVPSDLYTDLRVDFMVHEIIFQMVTTTLTWSAGTITRGGTEYTLAAGTLASAVGCYVIGTLSGGAVTLSLAPVANGIPTLSTGQVILAQTASVPSIDGNYIVYVRQANSVMLEGANIREASIYHAQIVSVDADTITVGTLDAAVIDVVNLNADNIVGGSIDASVIDVTNLNADNITAGGIRGINVNASSHTTNGSYLTQSCSAGAIELSLHSVEDFVGKSSGWIIDSTNDNDTFSYSGVDLVNKKLTGVLGVLAHSAGATVIPAVRTVVIDESTNDIRLYSASRQVVAISDSITYYEDEATTITGSMIIYTAASGALADKYGLIVSSTGVNSGSIYADAAFTAAKFVGRTGLSIVTKNGPPGYSSSGPGVSVELVDTPDSGHFYLVPTVTLPTSGEEGEVVMYRKSGWSYAKLCYCDASGNWRLVATDAIVT